MPKFIVFLFNSASVIIIFSLKRSVINFFFKSKYLLGKVVVRF
jgi:hypothetical protein